MTGQATIYFPRNGTLPPEPAPFILTGEEALRLLRMDGRADPDSQLKRLRMKGWLRGRKLGTEIVYSLPDVIRCIDLAGEADPR